MGVGGRRFTYFPVEKEGVAMEGLPVLEDLTPEEAAEVQRVYGLLRKATEQELWELARLMVSKPDSQLFGRTEFEIRDRVLRMGAEALQATVDDRKKGGTKAAAGPVRSVAKTRVSSSGARGGR
jgi:hypothetical protein